MKILSPLHAESLVSWLADTASACLIDEARLSPKPGLVDSRGNGAHQDLNLALMERSARSLRLAAGIRLCSLLCQRLKHSLPLRLPGSHTRRQPRP